MATKKETSTKKPAAKKSTKKVAAKKEVNLVAETEAKEVAIPEVKELAINSPADMDELLLQDAGSGLENMTKDDFAIPRLSILQALSPQVNKRDGEYVDGAEASMIMENVGNEFFDGEAGIIVVPLSFRRTIIEWALRESSGGFINDHGYQPSLLEHCQKDDKGRLINNAGNQLVDTCEYLVYIVTDGDWQPAMISMSSTQLRKSKRWNTLISSVKIDSKAGRITAPIFYMSYLLTTVPESNEKGSWFGWAIKKNKKIFDIEYGREIYLAARELKAQFDTGAVKVAEHQPVTGDDDSPM